MNVKVADGVVFVDGEEAPWDNPGWPLPVSSLVMPGLVVLHNDGLTSLPLIIVKTMRVQEAYDRRELALPPRPRLAITVLPKTWRWAPEIYNVALGATPGIVTTSALAPAWWHALRLPGTLTVR